jgi:hypothetical protein
LEPIRRGQYEKKVFRVGRDNSGRLEDLEDLDDAADLIEIEDFPRIYNSGRWLLQRFIVDQFGYAVRVSVISTSLLFTTGRFREEGVNLLARAIHAVQHGSLTLAESGSDADIQLDPFDLAVLQDEYERGQATGYFIFLGYVG